MGQHRLGRDPAPIRADGAAGPGRRPGPRDILAKMNEPQVESPFSASGVSMSGNWPVASTSCVAGRSRNSFPAP